MATRIGDSAQRTPRLTPRPDGGFAEIPPLTETEILRDQCQRIITDAPTYTIEREIALRLEAQQNRPIQENDLWDMQSFSAVVAYADIVVAENQFSNLATQAGLDKAYNDHLA